MQHRLPGRRRSETGSGVTTEGTGGGADQWRRANDRRRGRQGAGLLAGTGRGVRIGAGGQQCRDNADA